MVYKLFVNLFQCFGVIFPPDVLSRRRIGVYGVVVVSDLSPVLLKSESNNLSDNYMFVHVLLISFS